MWGYSFHSFSCSSHHLAGKPNHPASCWATILNLNLCHPVQPARSEAPDLGATGCAKAGGAPASTDAPSGGPPPERVAGSRCPAGPGAPSHPSSGRGQAPQPTSDHFTSRSPALAAFLGPSLSTAPVTALRSCPPAPATPSPPSPPLSTPPHT